MTIAVGIICFGLGGATIWFGKTAIQKAVIGANALSAKLHAEASAISGAINPTPKV